MTAVSDEFALVKDFAVIMMVAGAVVLLFRRLNQPPIVGYLVAGLLLGPHVLPIISLDDVTTIGLLADIGLILLLFGVGLEFNWNKIREVGSSVAIIAVVESLTMIGIGYSLGRLLGWSPLEALFLGGAMQVTSTAVIAQILRDAGHEHLLSSRLIVGVSVVEDFVAVGVLAVLSGVAKTGAADVGDVGAVVLKLVVFAVASLVIGALIVPRVLAFIHRFSYKDVFLIASLGMCFSLALIGKYLELSAASGAFLMGALIGNTRQSGDVVGLMAPIRDVFGAFYFVAMGMLINVDLFRDFLIPALVVTVVYVTAKIGVNSAVALITGHDARTALRVGAGMTVMGEFSLAVGKVGLRPGLLSVPLYPIVATATALTALLCPYIYRATDRIADLMGRRMPQSLRILVPRVATWLHTLREPLSGNTESARRSRRYLRTIIVNLLIVMVVIGIGTAALNFVEEVASSLHTGSETLALVLGLLVLVLCTPSLVVIWRTLQMWVDEVVKYLVRHDQSGQHWTREAARVMLRDSIVIVLTLLAATWFIPFTVDILRIGSITMAVPIVVLGVLLYVVMRSYRNAHRQVERTFSVALLGDSPREDTPPRDGVRTGFVMVFVHVIRWLAARLRSLRGIRQRGGRH